jgi:hypothetical protein
MGQRRPEPDVVLAWYVGEGDELPGGAKVVSVHREPVARSVRIVTDAPQTATVPHDHPVRVVRRGH